MISNEVIIHAIRLLPQQDLRQSIQHYAEEMGIEAGWIATCVGSLTTLHLRFANQSEGSRHEGHFEIVSLVGTVSRHGSHLHLCAGDGLGRTIGGHLLDGNLVYTTAEIVVGESKELVFTRTYDGTTAWKELQIRYRD